MPPWSVRAGEKCALTLGYWSKGPKCQAMGAGLLVIGDGESPCRCLSRGVLLLWEELLLPQQDVM